MSDWSADVVQEWRRLWSAPVFTLFSVLTLGLDIGGPNVALRHL